MECHIREGTPSISVGNRLEGFVAQDRRWLEHNDLYEECSNRYLNYWRPKITTLILGAKCKDGVVLIGDRKVQSDFGDVWADKIKQCGTIKWAVFGAAGVGPLFEEFLKILPRSIGEHFGWVNYQKQRLVSEHVRSFPDNPNATLPPMPEYNTEDFKHDCVELLTDIRRRYSVAFQNPLCSIQILIGTMEDADAKLYYLESANCIPVPVSGIFFIGQSSLAEWLRKCWNEHMTMEQTAKLGILAIKYIEQEEISTSVGVGVLQPQVWFIANGIGELPREIKGAELDRLTKDADKQVKRLRKLLHLLFRS